MQLHTLRRPLTASILSLSLLGGALAQTAAARADSWCWDDPVVSIAGKQVNIAVGVNASAVTAGTVIATRADIAILVPAGVPTSIISTQAGPFTETVHFVSVPGSYTAGKPIPVTVAVLITGSNKNRIATATKTTYNGTSTITSSVVVNTTYAYTINRLTL